jgi:hypothetical protein
MSSESETPNASDRPDASPEVIAQYSLMFDQACQERHDMGEEKYGPGKFLKVNTLAEAAYELIDLANYARYSFIRLMLVNDMLEELEKQTGDEGKFKRVGEGEWGKG